MSEKISPKTEVPVEGKSGVYANSMPSEGLDLIEVLKAIWLGRYIVAGLTFLFAALTLIYALSLPNVYVSTVVLAPADGKGADGLGGLRGQLGGVASLAGISLKGGGSNSTAEAIEIMKSWSFIEEFIKEKDIAPYVFAAVDWDQKTNKLIFDEDVYDPKSSEWLGAYKKAGGPSSWKLFEKFKGYLSLTEDKQTGFVKMSIEYLSPIYAKDWASGLVNKINTKIKKRDADQAQKNIAFLQQQISQTPLTSMHSIFYSLIEEQTKTLMLARGTDDYVFKTISEARSPEVKSKPKRTIICVVGSFLGFIVGLIISLTWYFLRLRNA